MMITKSITLHTHIHCCFCFVAFVSGPFFVFLFLARRHRRFIISQKQVKVPKMVQKYVILPLRKKNFLEAQNPRSCSPFQMKAAVSCFRLSLSLLLRGLFLSDKLWDKEVFVVICYNFFITTNISFPSSSSNISHLK